MLTLDFCQDIADVLKKHGVKKLTPACNGYDKPKCKCTGFLGLFKKCTPCYGCDPNYHRIGFGDDGRFEMVGMHIDVEEILPATVTEWKVYNDK